MKALLYQSHVAISRLPLDEVGKAAVRDKVVNAFYDCGCTMGSVFFVVTLVGLIGFAMRGGVLSPWWWIASLLMAAVVGKVLGMAVGRLRFLWWYRRLSGLVRTRDGSALVLTDKTF